MNQDEIAKSFTDHTLPEDPNESFMINGIKFANRKEYDERVERDVREFAVLLYDIYREQKHGNLD